MKPSCGYLFVAAVLVACGSKEISRQDGSAKGGGGGSVSTPDGSAPGEGGAGGGGGAGGAAGGAGGAGVGGGAGGGAGGTGGGAGDNCLPPEMTPPVCGASVCGNGVRDSCQRTRAGCSPVTVTEPCDGQDLGGDTCQKHGFGAGILSCSSHCAVDTSGCASALTSSTP